MLLFTLQNIPDMLQLNIVNMLHNKGINKPYAWLRKLKISHRVAYKLTSGEQQMLSLSVMTKICEAAWCSPSDLFVYVPDADKALPEKHPLEALAPAPVIDIASRISKLSPDKIKDLDKLIDELDD